MKAVEWHVRRLDNGSIDYAFYRAEATRQRTEAIRAFYATFARGLINQLRSFIALRPHIVPTPGNDGPGKLRHPP